MTQERVEIAKDKAEPFYDKISEYQSEVIGTSIPKEPLLDGLDGRIFNGITEASISDQTVSVEIEKVYISKIEIRVKNKVTNVNISIQKLPRKPIEIRAIPPGKNYAYFNIYGENLEDKNMEKATLQFKVEKSWIDKSNIDVNTSELLLAIARGFLLQR